MQFKPYPEYKDCGVEWLGEVPADWAMVRTKNLYNHRREDARENDEIVTAFRDGEVTLRKNRRTDGFTNSLQEHGYQHIVSGDLVIHEMDAFAGAIGVSDSDGKSTPVYTVCYPKNNETNNHYYADFFRTMASYGYINSLAKGIRVRSTEFRWNESRNVYLCAPSFAEQAHIAIFLETETAKIDNLIAKQEQLIKLLEEQRKSVITHAVTKGLDPDAPMKDSGVEWLGEVPSSWRVLALKRLADIQTGNTPPTDNTSYYSEDPTDIPWVKPENLNGFTPITETENYLTEVGAKFGRIIQKGSVLVCCIASIGKIGLAGTKVTTNQQINSITFNKEVNPDYGMYLLSSSKFEHERLANGNVVRILNSEKQGSINLCIPPIQAQTEIVTFLDSETTKIDKAISKQKDLIEKLKEYRSSVISHAVTGKIDVRDMAA